MSANLNDVIEDRRCNWWFNLLTKSKCCDCKKELRQLLKTKLCLTAVYYIDYDNTISDAVDNLFNLITSMMRIITQTSTQKNDDMLSILVLDTMVDNYFSSNGTFAAITALKSNNNMLKYLNSLKKNV